LKGKGILFPEWTMDWVGNGPALVRVLEITAGVTLVVALVTIFTF
jgi:hypothetical protein